MWGVEYFRHPLSIIDAEGVSAKGGMGVLVFEGFGLPLFLVVVAPAVICGWGRWFKGVVIQVSGRWRELEPGCRGVKLIVAVCVVGRSQDGSWALLLCTLTILIFSRGH